MRALSKEEMKELGMTNKQIEEALVLQKKKKVRRYKYIVLLTREEANNLTSQLNREVIPATKWGKK